MRSYITVFDKARHTELYNLELQTGEVYKMESTANLFQLRVSNE